ncbi:MULTISPECIES: Txe/YoeB family addiction module toxin [unclassified Acetobacterium]|jgi:Txe/YoeB family toxin of toxin-antitoxin system|uniref:Txe/YoeB family addiction module toxin n=1 Tax=unclassified Acetobacterium TaxID=2638182 RepID=UPI0019551241|nr:MULTISPECIES: Txe/YoeB family addiction module toxin [unclassified Acetobacterium]MDZ5725749.1 Txe/YoeB family addiction module toxin [Acetobacterium sp. K1/6]
MISKTAKKDKDKIKEEPAIKKKVEQLLRVLESNPYQNPPSYEKLSGEYRHLYSRRINRQHRLVYKVDEEQKVVIVSMWTHYEF